MGKVTRVSPREFAAVLKDELGITATPRAIRKLCAEGMKGATQDTNGYWKISPKPALKWIAARPNSSVAKKISAATAVPSEDSTQEEVEDAIADAASACEESKRVAAEKPSDLEQQLRYAEIAVTKLAAMVSLKPENGYLIDAYKKASSELRMLRQHAIDQRAAEGLTIETEVHRRVIATMATTMKTELEALSSTWPDQLLTLLDEGGVSIEDTKLALRLMTEGIDQLVHVSLRNMASAVRRTEAG